MAKDSENTKNEIVNPVELPTPIIFEPSEDQKFIETKTGILREEKIKNFKQKMKGRKQIPKPLKTK